MDDERQITADEEPADSIGREATGGGERTVEPEAGAPDDVEQTDSEHGDQDPDRIERLRALLTAPIKIPESESVRTDGPDEYPAPAADYSAPAAERPATATDVPPHVRAAAEAAAQAGHPGADRPGDTDATDAGDGVPKRTARKRRTWADAFLDTGRRDLPGADGDAATQLMTRLDDLDRRTGQEIARARTQAERAGERADAAHHATRAVQDQLDTTAQDTVGLTATTDTLGEAVESLREAIGTLGGTTDSLTGTTDTLRTALDALDSAVTEQRSDMTERRAEITELAGTLADTARTCQEAQQAATGAQAEATAARAEAGAAQAEAAAATKRVTVATALAVVAAALALVAIGLGLAL